MSGTGAQLLAYGPYGEPEQEAGPTLRYTGQRYEPETGLYYYKARFYSPYLGRFLQPDPIGYEDGLNLYAYVGNDPVNLTDPTGLCPVAKDGVPCSAVYDPGVVVSSPRLRTALDAIAAEADKPLQVYSGDRSASRNSAAGGAKRSNHLLGQAADVRFQNTSKSETADILYDSQARRDADVRLIYHMPNNGKLPEHSHIDLGSGPDLKQVGPNGAYLPLQDPNPNTPTQPSRNISNGNGGVGSSGINQSINNKNANNRGKK